MKIAVSSTQDKIKYKKKIIHETKVRCICDKMCHIHDDEMKV